jgi:sulfide:quinone oxidoreductase
MPLTTLHRVTEQLAVAPQIGKDDIAELARRGYRTIVNNRPDGEEPDQLSAAEARAEAERHGIAYHHIPVTTGSITGADVAANARAIAESTGPVLAHCRSGTRSYLLWAAAQILDGKAEPRQIVAEAAGKGFDLSGLPALVERLRRA